jgi:hypothetical protein
MLTGVSKGATEEGLTGEECYFNNISCSSENGVYVSAESPDKIDNIVFDNIDLLINKTTDVPGGIYDRRPADVEGFVKGSTSGFYFENAESIRVRNSHLRWGPQKAPYFNFVVESKKVKALELFNVTGSAAFSQKSKTKITR